MSAQPSLDWETEIVRVELPLEGGGSVPVDGVSIDSRQMRPGGLFVAIRGERDGHEFVAAAAAAGAAAAMVDHPVAVDLPQVVVADTAAALAQLARDVRGGLDAEIVGITGSVGKTTAKDLLAAVLAEDRPTHASAASHNNELGVPLTLLNAPDDVRAMVVEMGARGRGHIGMLCGIAQPTVGIVTVVAAAHTAMFGSEDDIAVAKGELVEALPASGVAVLNADDHRVAGMAGRTAAQVLTFGEAGEVRAEGVQVDDELRLRFRLHSPWGVTEVHPAVRGRQHVTNALAAAAAAGALGVPIEAIAAGLAASSVSRWRMEVARTPTGARLINDAYNANPPSMRAALHALAELPARRRVAVLGTMAELDDPVTAHREIAALARELGIELIAVGTDEYGPAPVREVAAVLERLGPLGTDDAVLVKGSRVAGLEAVAEALAQGSSSDTGGTTGPSSTSGSRSA
jgi:UDP-N-acetylmuramoyl-tripeptide--D-alanyl-D-alanine ligase